MMDKDCEEEVLAGEGSGKRKKSCKEYVGKLQNHGIVAFGSRDFMDHSQN